VGLAFPEEFGQRLEVTITVYGNHIVLTDKDVHLTGPCYVILLIEYGQVKDDEEMIVILIDFGTLYPTQNVIQVEMVEIEVLSEEFSLPGGRLFNVGPGHFALADTVYM